MSAGATSSATRQPLVSVIIPTYNRAGFLEKSVRSVLNQTYRNLECIVVDGASKDDSVAVLQRLAAEDPRLRFISEPDKGEIYAVGKGMDLAKGDIMGWQASDDYYLPHAMETSVNFLLQHPEYIGVAGDARYVDEHGTDLGRGVITYRGEMSRDTIRTILMVRYKSCAVCHGSFFGWRERLLPHGKFDPNFSVTPDWEYYLRLLAAGERIGCLPRVQYHFTIHSGMGAVQHAKKVETQRAILHQKHGMKWYHELIRSTVGRAASYFCNPHRSAFIPGVIREIKDAIGK
jgi:glycosyltransferase involved in cell wall biosynthesis